MKKIIAPVDFSAVSKNAARYAANMAALLNVPLVLMHVTELPISYGEVPSVPVNQEELTDEGTNLLADFAAELDTQLAGQVAIETLSRTGNPLYEITSYCNRVKPYALVIGTHGDSGITRLILGSTTMGVIKDCHIPVIIVPLEYTFSKPHKIGLASDLHDVMQTTPAEQVKRIVDDLNAKLEILHVDKNDMEEEQEIVSQTQTIHSMFAEQQPKIRFLKSVFTEETLLNYAAEKHLDLLIIVPKKHNWFELLVKHQHTQNIAMHADVPVMVLKNEN